MKITIWGARGSIPAPTRPAAIHEKVVSALLGVAGVSGKHRDDLLAAISEALPPAAFETDEAYRDYQQQRRRVVETYLRRLSPLAASTAGGNTPCLQIESGNDLFILDAGSGIRELGIKLMEGPCGRGEGVIHMLFSHPHWDHIQGFPFFRPAFIPGNKLFIYSVHDIEKALRRQQEFISFPISLDYMQADKTFIQIKPNEMLTFGDLRIRNICYQHPGDAYGFRFEKGNKVFVYASDSSYPNGMDMRPYLNFFADADLLVFDAQFTQRESDEKEDWGHSSSFVGLEMSQQAKVKNLLLFHYDPTYSDQDLEKILEDTLRFQQNQYPSATPVNVMIAQEGQTFDLRPPQTTQVQQVPGSKAAILTPTGIFDEYVAAELRDQLTAMVAQERPTQLIIDMAQVELLQVAGLRALVKLRKEYQGTPMALAGPSLNVQQLIELAGYLDFFAIYPSVHAALSALRARETMNLPGQVLKNRYRIDHKIGQGRLGTVFMATDTLQNTPVAIKILSPSFSEAAIEQFLRHARQIVNMSHPNIVEVYDCDDDRGIAFMAEEYLESKTLQELIDDYQGRSMPFDLALGIGQALIRALEYSHNHGVVHGDLKPKNVLLAGNTIKISDFGLGRLEGGKALINIDVPLLETSARYLAPEQVLGHPIDARTDLYTLGVVLYELFTGAPVVKEAELDSAEFNHVQPPPPPRQLNPRISRPLEHLILRLLDKDPNKRFASARQVRLILNSMALPVSRDRQPAAIGAERLPLLVGREAQLHQLADLWQASAGGNGQVALIAGPAGIGKSRLAHRAANLFQEGVVLLGSGLNMTGVPPYYPFTSALKAYFNHTPPNLAEQSLGRLLTLLRRHVPEMGHLTARFTGTAAQPHEPSAPPAGGLAGMLAEALDRRPLLLIVDDLHWADAASVQLLGYLAHQAHRLPVMIIVTIDEDAPQSRLLQQTLGQLDGLPHTTRLNLPPISQADTRLMLENIWSQSVPNDLITAIYHRTGGNPMFVEMIAQGLIDEGVVDWRDEKWYFGPVMEAGLPPRVNEAISRRIRRLSRETQSLLHQAAVLGETFNFDDLYELSDLSEWDALESINIALERQLLKNAPGEQALCFSHPLIRQELVGQLSKLKQRLLHREAGEALERQHLSEPKAIAHWLAHHFMQAGEPEKTLIYAIQAAAQAASVYAFQNALHWTGLALDTAEQIGLEQINQEQRFQLLLGLERLHHTRGQRPQQQTALNQLQQLAQQLHAPAAQAMVHLRQSTFEAALGRHREAATEAQAALIAARQAARSELESEATIQLATIALLRGELAEARELLYAAQNELTETEFRAIEARRLNGLGSLYRQQCNATESLQYFRQAAALGQAAGDRYGQALYLSNLADTLLDTGHFSEALETQNFALVMARFTGNRRVEALCLNRLAVAHCEVGLFDQAQSLVEQARRIHREIEDEQGQAADVRVIGRIQLDTRDFVAARDHIGQALEIFQRTKNRPEEQCTWLLLGEALAGLNHIDKARHAFEQAAQATPAQPPPEARIGLARCLLAEGQVATARQEIERLLTEEMAQTPVRQLRLWGNLHLTAHQILDAAGDLDAARRMVEAGYRAVQQIAAQIPDPALRAAYLEQVPAHRTLVSLHETAPVDQ
ncbi:MAG: hypothetical protein Kow0031_26100 [Anaerolineae bacterium]